MIIPDTTEKKCFIACDEQTKKAGRCTCASNKSITGNFAKPRLVAGLINGKAKELFLKWFKEEKLMTGFEDHSELVQIFALNEWFGIVGYKISIISRFIQDDFGYIVSVNEGEFYKYGLTSRMEAEIEAIEISNREFNHKLSEACH